jgi:hypothetical protein
MIIPDLSTVVVVGLLVAAQRRRGSISHVAGQRPHPDLTRPAELPANSPGQTSNGTRCPCWACAGYPAPLEPRRPGHRLRG